MRPGYSGKQWASLLSVKRFNEETIMNNAFYRDPAQPVDVRVEDLIGRMTLEEKIAQLHSFWAILSADGEHQSRLGAFGQRAENLSLKEAIRHGLGQVTRPLGTHNVEAREGVRALNELQRHLVEETRLGIPAIAHEEGLVGLMAQGATLFPASINFGCTFDTELMAEVGERIGAECRMVGARQVLAPVLDVSRDPRWGRTEETLGEDPYLTGVLASRYVSGMQGEKRDLLATLKHFVGHSASEGARNHAPVNLGFCELNDSFLLPFEMAIKQAGAKGVMPAYHDIDGEPCHASRFLLSTVLRDQWGFDGLVVADYAGIDLLYKHHGVATDAAQAAAIAFSAGLDVELPGFDCAQHLKQALERGEITPQCIDRSVRRILAEKFRMGLFENPYTDLDGIRLQSPEALETARRVASESAVLIENNGILPLDFASCGKVAVIGPTADDQLALLSGYSFPVHLIIAHAEEDTSIQYARTHLEVLRERLGTERVLYAKGCEILSERDPSTPVFPGDVNVGADLSANRSSPVSTDTGGIAAAVAAAAQADIALVFVGDLAGLFQTGTIGEGSDTDSLSLPGVQEQLVREVIATGTPTVIVVTSGRPYDLNGLEQAAAAVLFGFTPGQEGAGAIADLLCGVTAPSGRLCVSLPKSGGAVPYFYNHKYKSSGMPVAFHFGSRYPFGYGLTYTEFAYSDMYIEQDEVANSDAATVTVGFELRNVGPRSGTEVVQLYVRDVLATRVRPIMELKGFHRVTLEPGNAVRVQFEIPTDMFGFTGNEHQRVVEPGEFRLMFGAASNDIRLSSSVRLMGHPRTLPRDWRMESRCTLTPCG